MQKDRRLLTALEHFRSRLADGIYPRSVIALALSVGLVLCLPATARADIADLAGLWSGVCVDANGSSKVKGEVCFRGAGEAREVSLWGGAFRTVFRINEVKSSERGDTIFEVTSFHWDQGTATLRFDRKRLRWTPSKNEAATVVHRSQELRLIGTDSMDEPASEWSSRETAKPVETRFRCTLRRESRKVNGGCANCCPTPGDG